MDEIKISIEVIKSEMFDLEAKAIKYSEYGRCPNTDDWVEIRFILNKWEEKRQQLIALEEVLSSIISNAQTQQPEAIKSHPTENEKQKPDVYVHPLNDLYNAMDDGLV